MKYYLIAGEASGDLHGSNLIKGLKKTDKEASFRFFGGNLMQKAGKNLVKHYREMAFMGFVEVLANLRTISRNIKTCKEDLQQYKPDVLILIDYAGFNLRIARFAKSIGITVFFYISPKIWAWKESRIKLIKEHVDRMFVILPFEVDYYVKHNMVVDYEGNPLIDAIAPKIGNKSTFQDFTREYELKDQPIIALLAGSRKQEIDRCLPEMLAVIKDFPGYQFVIAGSPSVEKVFYNKYIKNHDVGIVYNKTYDLLLHAHSAIVTSGTATLETALLNVPQVVIYKTSPVTYHVGKHFVNIKYFSLVNLITDKEVVKELLQFNLAGNIKDELNKILNDKPYRQKMLDNYKEIAVKIGAPGVSERVALKMHAYLNN
jgi:lipid-A-disaccharide synthase